MYVWFSCVAVLLSVQAVQAAVDHQIHSLTSSHPHQRVALITFSDEVCHQHLVVVVVSLTCSGDSFSVVCN